VALAVAGLSAISSFLPPLGPLQTRLPLNVEAEGSDSPPKALSHIASRVAHGEPVQDRRLRLLIDPVPVPPLPRRPIRVSCRFALQNMFPFSEITVLNKGVPGERVQTNGQTLPPDVLENTRLLIWQTGTNSALAIATSATMSTAWRTASIRPAPPASTSFS